MPSELPLKIRADIRDQWDSPRASIHTSLEAVKKVLGVECPIPDVEWQALWQELQYKLTDKSVFVPSIVRYSITWYERLLARLENDAYESWTEELLVKMESGRGKLCLLISANANASHRPVTQWKKDLGSFTLSIPKADPASHEQLTSSFEKDFDNLFSDNPVDEEDWAQVPSKSPCLPINGVRLQAVSLSGPIPVSGLTTERLPIVDALARPASLFTGTGPYIMQISVYGKDSVRIDCSHEPTLQTLASYLEKWGRPNPNNNQKKVFQINLTESDFCFGVVDSMTVVPTTNYYKPINPTLILAFVEGVLGYKMVHTTGNTWMYRSSTLLK